MVVNIRWKEREDSQEFICEREEGTYIHIEVYRIDGRKREMRKRICRMMDELENQTLVCMYTCRYE